METTQYNTSPTHAPQPSPSRRQQRRARKFHAILNEEIFEDFILPVTLEQVEQAVEYLDQHFGCWEKPALKAAADYVLPAVHTLFPEQRRFGFTAPFGPKRSPREGFGQWLDRCVFGVASLAAPTRRRESPGAQ